MIEDLKIPKTLKSLQFFFTKFRPTFNSTNFYLKRDATIIPVWGYGMSSDNDISSFVVNTRTKSNKSIFLDTLYSDELYFTTSVLTLPGLSSTAKPFDYSTLTLEALSAGLSN